MNWLEVFRLVCAGAIGGFLVELWYAYQRHCAEQALCEAIDIAKEAPSLEQARRECFNANRRARIALGVEAPPFDFSEWIDLYRDAPDEPRMRTCDFDYYFCVGMGQAAWGSSPMEAYAEWQSDVQTFRKF